MRSLNGEGSIRIVILILDRMNIEWSSDRNGIGADEYDENRD